MSDTDSNFTRLAEKYVKLKSGSIPISELERILTECISFPTLFDDLQDLIDKGRGKDG